MKIKRLIKIFILLSGLLISFGSQAAIGDASVQAALKEFYSSTGGPSWTNSTGWTAVPISCTAYGITCVNNDVEIIELINNNLVGPIPSSIGQLISLVRLRLQDNKLNGNIPSELGSLTNLKELRMYNNELEGPIPASVSNLINLLYLELHRNRLSGQIPNGLGNLTNLWYFYVNGNQFIGDLPTDLDTMGSASIDRLYLDLKWNAVISTDATINTFINSNHVTLYENSQTLAPTGLAWVSKTTTSVDLAWDVFETSPISPGGYRVLQATTANGPFTEIQDIFGRSNASLTVTGLDEGVNYWFKVCNYTSPHTNNTNLVISEDSIIVSKGVPTVTSINKVVTELTAVSMFADAIDDDGSITSYSWAQLSGTGVVLSGVDTATASFTAPDAPSGGEVLGFRVTVTDDDGDVAFADVQITVNNINVLPTVNAGLDQNVNEGNLVTLSASGNDTDGTITYQWEQLSGTSANIANPISASFSFTAPGIDTATEILEFKVTVTDNDGGAATDTVQVTVNNLLIPPTLDDLVDQIVDEGTTASLSASAHDANGSIVGYGWSQISGTPVTLTVTNEANLSFTAPDVGEAGDILVFEVIATDNDGQTVTGQVQVTVNDVKIGPVADPTTDNPADEVEEDDWIELISNAYDEDGVIIDYLWEQLEGPDVHLESIDTPRTRFQAPRVNGNRAVRLMLRVTVTDDDGLIGTGTIYVIITKKNVIVTGGGALGWPWLLLLGMPLLGRRFLK